MPAQTLRTEVPAAALEPALLPGCGMPAAGSPLAGSAAASQTPPGCRGQSTACRGATRAPPARQIRPPNTEECGSCGGAWSRSGNFFDYPCVPGRGATNGRFRRFATRDATAALPAVRRFTRSWIVNVSGGRAELSVAVANGLRSIRQRARNGPGGHALGPARRPLRCLRRDTARGPRRSSIIAWPRPLDY